MEQVISISPTGEIYGLDFKRKGIQLRQFGEADIQRVTIIEWSKERQQWYIRWEGRHGNSVWTKQLLNEGGIEPEAGDTDLSLVVYFDEYEEAVAVEQMVIQSLREQGKEGQ